MTLNIKTKINSKIRIFCILCFCWVLTSCQTLFKKSSLPPSDLNLYKQGGFSGSITLQQKNKKYHFVGDLFFSPEEKGRMDLSFSYGPTFLTLFWNKKETIFLFLREKKFYKGQGSSGFLPKNLHLSDFKEAFFHRPPKSKKWVCDKKVLPSQCQSGEWKLNWEKQKNYVVSLKGPDFKLIFRYASFSPKIDDTLWQVAIPPDFVVIAGDSPMGVL